MKKIKLYSVYSTDFIELINNSKNKLKNEREYKILLNKIQSIYQKFPNVKEVLENEKSIELSKIDCEQLQNIINIYLQMRYYEERNIFFLGGEEAYSYFKNINIIKGVDKNG